MIKGRNCGGVTGHVRDSLGEGKTKLPTAPADHLTDVSNHCTTISNTAAHHLTLL